jgi:hypothetical protein
MPSPIPLVEPVIAALPSAFDNLPFDANTSRRICIGGASS